MKERSILISQTYIWWYTKFKVSNKMKISHVLSKVHCACMKYKYDLSVDFSRK